MQSLGKRFSRQLVRVAAAALVVLPAQIARADEGGVSFWIPGFFGSLAAVPAQAPGWSVTSIYYHDSVSAGGDVALAREFEIRNLPFSFTGTASANVNANINVELMVPTYTFATPVLGAQVSVALLGLYGANSTTLAGTLAGNLAGPLGGSVPFSRFDSINSSIVGFGDLIPFYQMKWNAGVNNYMFYATGDIPVGMYDSMRLANLGIGHWAFDVGGGYTYFDQAAGHEFSAVLGFTYNFINPATQYQNGVDMHFDWGA